MTTCPNRPFYMVGGIEQAVEKAKKLAEEAGKGTMPLHFELVTPARLVRSEDVHMVVVPGTEGEFGVLEGHAPFMSTDPRRRGMQVFTSANATPEIIQVRGGFAEVQRKGPHCAGGTRRRVSFPRQSTNDQRGRANGPALFFWFPFPFRRLLATTVRSKSPKERMLETCLYSRTGARHDGRNHHWRNGAGNAGRWRSRPRAGSLYLA